MLVQGYGEADGRRELQNQNSEDLESGLSCSMNLRVALSEPSLGHFFFLITALLDIIIIQYHTIHPIKVYNSMPFCILTELYVLHHNPF